MVIGYGTLTEDRTAVNLGSDPSVCTHSSPELPSSPMHRPKEDLYNWMVKQDSVGNNLEGSF